jgi:hypothetical protein
MTDSASSPDSTSESLVTFRVPRALKNSWVRQSQQAGAKLTDWIVGMVAFFAVLYFASR